MADALSRKPSRNAPSLEEEFAKLNLCVGTQAYLSTLEVKPNLEEEVKTAQANSSSIAEIKAKIARGRAKEFSVDAHNVLRYGTRLCVPEETPLKQRILQEAHESAYSIHPGALKCTRT